MQLVGKDSLVKNSVMEDETRSMVGHVIGRLKVEVLLRLADFMTKRRLPAQRWGSTGCACKVTARRSQAPVLGSTALGNVAGQRQENVFWAGGGALGAVWGEG